MFTASTCDPPSGTGYPSQTRQSSQSAAGSHTRPSKPSKNPFHAPSPAFAGKENLYEDMCPPAQQGKLFLEAPTNATGSNSTHIFCSPIHYHEVIAACHNPMQEAPRMFQREPKDPLYKEPTQEATVISESSPPLSLAVQTCCRYWRSHSSHFHIVSHHKWVHVLVADSHLPGAPAGR